MNRKGNSRSRHVHPLSVLLIMPIYPPDVGGAAQYSSILVARMLRDPQIGTVVVLTARTRRSTYVEHAGRCTIYRAFPCMGRGKEPFWVKGAKRLGTQIILCAFLVLSGLLRKFDIVHVHGNFCRIAGRLRNYPLEWILTAFKLDSVLDLRDQSVTPVLSRVYREIICASLAIRDAVATRRRNRIHYIPTPIEVERITQVAKEALMSYETSTCPYVCCVGEVSARKGIPELLEAFRRYVIETSDHLRLLLVGPLAGIAEETLAGAPWIVYLGARPWEECLAIISRAEAFLCPSHSEGLPRVCLEALTLGRKVLLPPGIKEFGYLCPNHVLTGVSAQEIREKLDYVLTTDPPRVDVMRFDIELTWPEYLNVYAYAQSRRRG